MRRKYKYQSEADIGRMIEQFGLDVFIQYIMLVEDYLKNLPTDQWIDYEVYMDSESIEPFIIVSCLFMINTNTLAEYWSFNEDYSRIRRYKKQPPYTPLYHCYEKK